MPTNTKPIGIAYTDQALQDGTMSGYTVTGGTISGATINGVVVTSGTYSGITVTGSTLSGTHAGTASFSALAVNGTATIGASSANTVGFFAQAGTTWPTTANQAAAAATGAVSVSATQWGFSTSTQANAIVTLVNQLRSDLVALGIIKGS